MAASNAVVGPIVTKISNGIKFTHSGNRFTSPYFIDKEKQIRECGDCREIKSFTEFYIRKRNVSCLCKTCQRKQNRQRDHKAYYKNHTERVKAAQRKNKYGLTQEEYKLLQNQANGRCTACNRQEKLFVDHCHKTGKVRGLICRSCNTGLGQLEDSAWRVEALLKYIKNHD